MDEQGNESVPTPMVKGEFPSKANQFKRGQMGNPTGSTNPTKIAITKAMHAMGAADLTEEELRMVAKDRNIGFIRRAAANQLLRIMERPDLADYEGWLQGQADLRDLRNDGHDTSLIKKAKVKHRMTPGGEEFVEREIELHDRAGESWDRLIGSGKSEDETEASKGGIRLGVVLMQPPPKPDFVESKEVEK